MEKMTARILLLGKTGVGKSSFINYFLGRDIAKTGIGKPVTQELTEYELEYNNIILNVTDSKGLEVENIDEIKKEIINTIKKRNNNDNIFDWYHSIFYCISLANARIEDYEINLLKKLKKEIAQNIHIIITNCDDPEKSIDQITGMKNKLISQLGENINIYTVCSVEMRKRNGKVILPYGRDTIINGVFDLLWKDICWKISEEFSKKVFVPKLENFIENKYLEFEKQIKENITLWGITKKIGRDIVYNDEQGLNEILSSFESKVEKFKEELDDKIAGIGKKLDDKIKEILLFYSAFYNNILNGLDIVENISLDFYCNIDFDEIIEKSTLGKINNILDSESSTWKEKFFVVKKLLDIQNTILELVLHIKKETIEQLKSFNFQDKIYQELVSNLKKEKS